ncbi:MAG: hypothetical protein R3D33_12185 [Hyphomicrobiaceae bacterium]
MSQVPINLLVFLVLIAAVAAIYVRHRRMEAAAGRPGGPAKTLGERLHEINAELQPRRSGGAYRRGGRAPALSARGQGAGRSGRCR